MWAIRHLGLLAVVYQVVLYTRISTVHKYALRELTTFIYKSILDLKGKIQVENFLSQKARGRDEGDLCWISQDRDQVDGNGFAVCGINKRNLVFAVLMFL